MSSTWRRVYFDDAGDPATGALCEVEVPYDGAAHDGPHVYTRWENGEIAGPVYWSDVT